VTGLWRQWGPYRGELLVGKNDPEDSSEGLARAVKGNSSSTDYDYTDLLFNVKSIEYSLFQIGKFAN
jgi:hypothetical protein